MLNSAFPLSVSLHNQFQQEQLAVLYIVSKDDPKAATQQVTLKISQQDTKSYQFKALKTVAADSFHFAITFRRGTLHEITVSKMQSILQTALKSALPQVDCLVSSAVTLTDGGIAWYIGFAQDVSVAPTGTTPWQLALKLSGIHAADGDGSRSSQVEMAVTGLTLSGTVEPLAFKRFIHVDIINHLGHAYVPLYFSVFGDNTLLNRAGHQNTLEIYCEALNRVPITFSADTKISFQFNSAEAGVAVSAVQFGNQTEVAAYSPGSISAQCTTATAASAGSLFNQVPSAPDTVSDSDDAAITGACTFTYSSLSNSPAVQVISIRFPFSNIQLSGADGTVMLTVTVKNLPGYWDSSFQVPVIKRSTTANEQLQIGGSTNIGYYSNGSRIEFLSSGMSNTSNTTNVSLEERCGLNITGTPAVKPSAGARGVPSQNGQGAIDAKPVKIRNADLLIPEGRLAVGGGYYSVNGLPEYPTPETGDANTNEKLNVNGDSFFNGHVGISGDAGITGQVTIGMSSIEKSSNASIPEPILNVPYASDYMGLLVGSMADMENGWAAFSIAQPSNPTMWPFVIMTGKKYTTGVDTNGNFVTKGDISSTGGRVKDKYGEVMPVGTVLPYYGQSAPKGWLLCDGSAIPSKYKNLQDVIGMATTPDLRGRTLIGTGHPSNAKQSDGTHPNFLANNNWWVGYTGGEYRHQLSEQEMPSHQHFGFGESSGGWPYGNQPNMVKKMGSHGGIDYDNYFYGTSSAGGNQPHNNMQPYCAVNYIIKC